MSEEASEGTCEAVPLGLWTRMESHDTEEGSCSIWIDEGDAVVAETVRVEGADGYERRRSTYAVEMFRKGREG